MHQSSLHPSHFRPQTSPTWYGRWPINGKAFSHVSWKTEEACGFLRRTDESSHSGRAVDGFQLRLKVKYFYLSFLRPHGSQRLLSTLGRLKFHTKTSWSENSDNTQGLLGQRQQDILGLCWCLHSGASWPVPSWASSPLHHHHHFLPHFLHPRFPSLFHEG